MVISIDRYRSDVATGARAMAPWLMGLMPLGLVIGITGAGSHLPTLAGWLTGPAIYAGSAQITMIQMLDAGAAPVAVVATVLLINIRLFLYSAAMAPHWRGTPAWWRLIAGYLLVDPSFVVGMNRYGQPGDRRRAHAHYLGGALLLWVAWLAAITVGAAAGATAGTRLPAWLRPDFLIPLYLVGQVITRLDRPEPRRAAVVAAAVAGLALAAPVQVGIPLGIVAGIAAGLVRRSRTSAPTKSPAVAATKGASQ